MKIDDKRDALLAAKHFVNSDSEKLAKALLEAHLEGIDQARSLIGQGRSLDQISQELDARRAFILSQLA